MCTRIVPLLFLHTNSPRWAQAFINASAVSAARAQRRNYDLQTKTQHTNVPTTHTPTHMPTHARARVFAQSSFSHTKQRTTRLTTQAFINASAVSAARAQRRNYGLQTKKPLTQTNPQTTHTLTRLHAFTQTHTRILAVCSFTLTIPPFSGQHRRSSTRLRSRQRAHKDATMTSRPRSTMCLCPTAQWRSPLPSWSLWSVPQRYGLMGA